MYILIYTQHPLVNDFNERSIRKIDRMKRKKIEDEEDWNIGSNEEGDSLEQPTIKKGGDSGIRIHVHVCVHIHVHVHVHIHVHVQVHVRVHVHVCVQCTVYSIYMWT